MTSFTRTWSDAYEGLPSNDEDARDGASRIRNFKTDVRERMQVDHNWSSDGGNVRDGTHNRVSLTARTSDPLTDTGVLQMYVKNIGGQYSLFVKNDKGGVLQLTGVSGGTSNSVPSGAIMAFGNSVDAVGPDYIQCDGREISRTGYPALLFAIGIAWGAGDGLSTFNVPNLSGRTLIGKGTGDYTAPVTTRVVGTRMGRESDTFDVTQITSHYHLIRKLSGSIGTPGTAAFQMVSATDGYDTSQTAGGDINGICQPHSLMQPSAVINWWIKT